jgi:hypothetical protein
MQKISESVQRMQITTQQNSPSTPEVTKSRQVTQNIPTSPSVPLGYSTLQPQENPKPSVSSLPPQTLDSGKSSSPTHSYFALQVSNGHFLFMRASLFIIVCPSDLLVFNICLQIGINYKDSAAPLAGCVNDIRGWADLFRSLGRSFNTHIICR